MFSPTVPAPVISNYQTGSQGDSAWVSFQLKGSRYIVQAGPLHLLKADFFHASEPPELTADQRHHPVWYGPPLQVETEIVWQLPNGRSVELDTPSLKSACDLAALSSEMTVAGNKLRFVSIQQHTGKIFPA
jgi:hypothetical protein